MIAKLQICNGISSQVTNPKPNGKHYILWDLENCTLKQLIKELIRIQIVYSLADIYITTDKEKSFRAWCFSQRTLKQYLEILINTEYTDYAFISWTVRRKKAILRIGTKIKRKEQKLVAVLKGYEPYTIPEEFQKEIYETGYTKLPQSIKNYKV